MEWSGEEWGKLGGREIGKLGGRDGQWGDGAEKISCLDLGGLVG